MRPSQTPQALQTTLQFLMTSDIPPEHKSVLIEMLTQALRDLENAGSRPGAGQKAEWRADETAQVRSFLQGRIANSWQQADELSMHLAGQLHRDLQDVRSKATELGFGVAVDYRLARARLQSRRE